MSGNSGVATPGPNMNQDDTDQRKNGQPKRYRIVVLGAGGVGKSALTLQYVQHNFFEHHDPTIEDAYQQRTVIDSEPCLLDILDTAGQVEFTAMREQYMRCGEGFIVCFSITDRHSFLECEEYRNLIIKVRAQDNVPIILVANKVDLDQGLGYHQRQVSQEEGQALANKFGCPYIETSAAHRRHVDDVFHTLVGEIKRQRMEGNKDTEKKLSRWKKMWLSISMKTKIRFSYRRGSKSNHPTDKEIE
jgi:small GTP-binding protein